MIILENPDGSKVEFKTQFQLMVYLNQHAIKEGETRITYEEEKIPVQKIPTLSVEKAQGLLPYLKGDCKKSIKSHISAIRESQIRIKKEVYSKKRKDKIKMEVEIILYHKRKMFAELVEYLKELRKEVEE